MNQATALAHIRGAAEAMLLEYARLLDERRAGRQAVWLHISRLESNSRSERYVRVAMSGLDALADGGGIQVFALSNADIVAVFTRDRLAAVRAEVEKICYLFGEDPLLRAHRERFLTWFDLEKDYEDLLRAVRGRADDSVEPDDAAPAVAPKSRIAERQLQGGALTPAKLERIERVLESADVSNLVRRQAVCAVAPDQSVLPRYNELYVSIAELRDTVLPGGDLAGNPWLFRRLTQILDRRVLAVLTTSETTFGDGGISVNVNVSTLLSDAFAALDQGLAGIGPSAVAFELQAVDIFSDIAAFLFARDFAHRKGFRIHLDGLRWQDADIIDCLALGVDTVKVPWDKAMVDEDGEGRAALAQLVRELGDDRVVLIRVDSMAALTAGLAAGVSLFQGYHIDALVREDMRRRDLLRQKRAYDRHW